TPYGGTIYGVEEASQNYFGISAKDLTLAQAATIASLPKGPSYYSPYGTHSKELESRKNLVLKKMLEQKYITAEEYIKAKAEKITYLAESNNGIKAPHFVFYVIQTLIDKYGEEAIQKGGFKVTTTLDWELQKKAEEMLTKKALENAVRLNASNAGLVAINPKTGGILAMVGSRGYFDEKIDGKVNIALAKRQPGSAFKPFVYTTAFQKGYTPDTVVFDLKTQFSTSCSPDDFTTHDKCYSPSNFNEKIHGPMTMRNALAQSVNIASVKTLYLAGINDSITTATAMGITTLTDRNRYGLALVLGGGEVTLLDITSAYGVFANDGVRNPATGILKIEDPKNNVVYAYEASSTVVLDPQIARTMTDILSDNEARTPEFGPRSPLYFPDVQIGVKTGTTNDYRDAWIVGYSSGIAIGVWAGNNDNTPMKQRIAEVSAAPLWHQVMQYSITKGGYPALAFEKPYPRLDTASLPPVLKGVWNSDPALGIHDILYWIDKNHPTVASAQTSVNDPQFSRWDYPVQLWAYQNDPNRPLEATSTLPDNSSSSTIVMQPESEGLAATQP
nr:transglycosylase domain-containing protein [Patescibacteria group bacterium]